jgi:hypothetical protein
VESQSQPELRSLLSRLCAFLMPGGEEAARLVRRVRLKEQGEMRSAPDARWIPFTAEERIDAWRSGFVWEARMYTARVVPMVVVDAYEEGEGRLVVKLGGAVPVVNSHGKDYNKGELQRYLSGITICPPMLVANPTLVWTQSASQTLHLRDSLDPDGTAVEYEIGADGVPMCCRAERPRALGKKTVLTSWAASGLEFREWDGLRVATRLEAAWHLPGGAFTYYRGMVTAFAVEREPRA